MWVRFVEASASRRARRRCTSVALVWSQWCRAHTRALYRIRRGHVDVILQTNSSVPYLGLLGIRRFADGSGFSCQLVVRCHGFVGSMSFWPEEEVVRAFVVAVNEMNRTLAGTARLRPMHEDGFVELEVSHTGAVLVRGELLTIGDSGTTRLEFAFRTDQTCLGPLAADLAGCLRE